MKRYSKKPSKKTNSSSGTVKWFGIRIIHIALYIAILCLIVCGLLVKQALTPQTFVLAAHDEPVSPHEMTGFGEVSNTVGKGVGDSEHALCVPRPSCLSATPKCLIAEPADGWCPLSGTPEPPHEALSITPAPQGCFYNRQCTTISCPSGVEADECYACKKTLVCPRTESHPSTTCTPRPTCAPGQECPLQSKEGMRWCPPVEISSTPETGTVSAGKSVSTTGIGDWFSSIFHTLFH